MATGIPRTSMIREIRAWRYVIRYPYITDMCWQPKRQNTILRSVMVVCWYEFFVISVQSYKIFSPNPNFRGIERGVERRVGQHLC